MKLDVKTNVNNYVKVKLNDVGLTELERQHNELKEIVPTLGEFKNPKVDEDGYSEFQIHCFMNLFGHIMIMGMACPFEAGNIIICNCEESI